MARLTSVLPAASNGDHASLNLQSIAALPTALRAGYSHAFADAMDAVFLTAAIVALAGFGLTWLLPEKPLRGAVAARSADVGQEVGEAMAMPHAEEEAEDQPAERLPGLREQDGG